MKLDIKPPVLSGNGWRLFNTGVRSVAIQGRVSYPIDVYALNLKFGLGNKLKDLLQDFSLELDFNIGELDVAVSREALSYTSLTCNSMFNKLKTIENELLEVIKNKIDSFEGTEWNQKLQIVKFRSENYKLWNFYDEKLDKDFRTVSVDFSYYPHLSINEKPRKTGKYSYDVMHRMPMPFTDVDGVTTKENKILSIEVSQLTKFFVIDEPRPKSHLMTYAANNFGKWSAYTIYEIYPHNYDIASIMKDLGNPEYVLTSSLPKPERAKRQPAQSKQLRSYYELKETGNFKNSIALAKKEFPTSGIYVDFVRGYTKYNGSNIHSVADIIESARKLGWISTDKIWVFSNSENKQFAAGNDNWINLFDMISINLEKWLFDNQNILNNKAVKEIICFPKDYKTFYDDISKRDDFNDIKDTVVFESYLAYKELNSEDLPAINADIAYLQSKIAPRSRPAIGNLDDKKNLFNFEIQKTRISQQYPMLEYFFDSHIYQKDDQDRFVEYIKLINKTKEANNVSTN